MDKQRINDRVLGFKSFGGRPAKGRHAALAIAAAVAGLTAACTSTYAATLTSTWNDRTVMSGNDGKFNTGANWTNSGSGTLTNPVGSFPQSANQSLVFNTGVNGTSLTDNALNIGSITTGGTTTNNVPVSNTGSTVAGAAFAGITFSGAADFTITGATPNTSASSAKSGSGFGVSGSITVSGGNQTINDLVVATGSSASMNVATGATLTLGSGIPAGTFAINNTGGNAGTVKLVTNTGTASTTGGAATFKVAAGTLVLGLDTTTGSHAANQIQVAAGATVQMGGSGFQQLYAHSTPITAMNGNLDLNGTSQLINLITTSSGKIYNSATGTTSTLTLGLDSNTTSVTTIAADFAGTIQDNTGTGSGKMALYLQSGNVAGTTASLTLTGQNTYTGTTTVAAAGTGLALKGSSNPFTYGASNATATLVLGNASNTLAPTNAVVLGGANDTSANLNTLQLGNATTTSNQTLGSLTLGSGATPAQNRVVNGGTGGSTLNINNTSGTTDSFNGILGGTTATEKILNLAVKGGTFAVTNTNTYTGTTTVLPGTAGVAATLAGTGSIASSSVSVTGLDANTAAVISPGVGATLGTLSTGDVTFNSNSTFALNFNSSTTTTSLLAASGSVTLGGNAALLLNDLGTATFTSPTTFAIITAGGGVSGQFAGLAEGATVFAASNPSQLYTVDYRLNEVDLVAVVPEPTSVAVLGVGALLGLRRRRNRQQALAN